MTRNEFSVFFFFSFSLIYPWLGAGEANNPEMPMGEDKLIPKESLLFVITGPGIGNLTKWKLLDNNSSTPTKHHRENCSPTPTIQQRLRSLEVHLHSANNVPLLVLAVVSEGKEESWNFHSHPAAVRPVPLPCHQVNGDHTENSNEVALTLPGEVVSTEDQRGAWAFSPTQQ